MADSAVAVTAGSGTNIDTRTEGTNGNHRQVVVIGDPATNAGVAPVDATNGVSVTLTTAIPAGSNAIGKLAANSGVDIGDVDVTSLPALASGTNTIGKLGANSGVDIGDVDVTSLPALAAGTNLIGKVSIDQVTASANEVVVKSALPAGTNAIGKLSANSGVDIGDVDILSIAAGTNLIGKVSIDQVTANANEVVVKSALPAGTNAIGKLSANSGVDIGDVDILSIAAGDNNIGNVDIASALPAGTNAIGKLAANSGVDIGDVDVTSISAGDNNIGNVDIASAIPAGTNIIGAVKLDVRNYTAINKYYSATGATTDGIVWSPAGGKKWVVTDLTLTTSAAATVTLENDLVAGDSAVMAWDLAANGGVSLNLQTPLVGTENDADLIVTTSAGNIKIFVSGYEI